MMRDNDEPQQREDDAYVRYLFDQNLFNVPNNYQRCSFLLTYLRSEGLFDVSYVIGRAENRFKSGVLRNTISSKTSSSSVPGFHVSASFDRVPNDEPLDRDDIKRHMQRVWLTGDEREWLDLKVKLCMPSIIVFFKLAGSTVSPPNADMVVQVAMQDLRLLHDKRSLGEKLAVLLATLRRDYFGTPVPDFDELAIQHAALLPPRSSRRNDGDTHHHHRHHYNHQQQQQQQRSDDDLGNHRPRTIPLTQRRKSIDDEDGMQVEDATTTAATVATSEVKHRRDMLLFGGGQVMSVEDVH